MAPRPYKESWGKKEKKLKRVEEEGKKNPKAVGGIQGVAFDCKIFNQFLTSDILLISVVEERTDR